ncbi:Eps3O [Leuconostoc citreum LBAE E16]|uniref:DUF6625 family protein n=1 Tax=Leuconostoc citreum TaxID=33964 RepID=UPI0002465FFF|nr:DUF6625 family protein [Leuconostoc citreum]CCF28018.1 Eps3O [Leuconostoc citreum LBAE E16]
MTAITLISPYFGNSFPQTFPLLINSMANNKNVRFIIPTNLDVKLPENCENILFIKSNLSIINNKIDKILGYHAHLDSAYKLVDFKPMYGVIFSEYISKSEWWGYFDSDVIFGNISNYLTDELLSKYDRIFNLGHLTLFRNNHDINYLWKRNYSLPGVPSFEEVATSKAIFAFDEWGWGKNRGRGLSYALKINNNVKQYDNPKWIADVLKDEFSFNINGGSVIDYFLYRNGKLFGYKNSELSEFLYVHFQKRSIKNMVFSYDSPIYIMPNVIDTKAVCHPDELKRWKINHRKQILKHKLSNLNIWYLKRRLRFMNTE